MGLCALRISITLRLSSMSLWRHVFPDLGAVEGENGFMRPEDQHYLETVLHVPLASCIHKYCINFVNRRAKSNFVTLAVLKNTSFVCLLLNTSF